MKSFSEQNAFFENDLFRAFCGPCGVVAREHSVTARAVVAVVCLIASCESAKSFSMPNQNGGIRKRAMVRFLCLFLYLEAI